MIMQSVHESNKWYPPTMALSHIWDFESSGAGKFDCLKLLFRAWRTPNIAISPNLQTKLKYLSILIDRCRTLNYDG